MRESNDIRVITCGWCGLKVWICRYCDCGHRYCCQDCSKAARRESNRRAGERYQKTEQGRANHKARQQRAERSIAFKRSSSREIKPAHVWTFFVPGLLYGGWHLYLTWLGGNNADQWIKHRYDSEKLLTVSIMGMYPCGYFPIIENVHCWKRAFAKQYARNSKFKKNGKAPCWVSVRSGSWVEAVDMTRAGLLAKLPGGQR